MKVETSFQQLIFDEIFIGKKIYCNDILEIISVIGYEPDTRRVIFKTASGKEFTALKDELFEWEVNAPKETIRPKKRVKGKI